MQKNEINGIKAFNRIKFNSCFYYQLITGLSCFDVDQDSLLLSCASYIQEGFKIENNFFLEDKKFAREMGYKINKFRVSKKRLTQAIDKGCPLIIGVDYFYLQSNAQTYMKRHTPHFILVYGYDLNSDEVNVVDHDYVNSAEYVKSRISLENLLFANKMLRRSRYESRFMGYLVKPVTVKKDCSVWDYVKIHELMKNQDAALKNIEALKQGFLTDLDQLQQRQDEIIQYLKEIQSFYLIYSNIACISQNPQRMETVSCLISAYSNILSLFWKMKAQKNYKSAQKMLNAILRKLDEIVRLEECFYTYVLEAKK